MTFAMPLNGGESTPASTDPALRATRMFEVVPVPNKVKSLSGVRPLLLRRARANVSVEEPMAVMPMILFLRSDIDFIYGFAMSQKEGLVVMKPTTLTGKPRAAPAITCDCAPEKSMSAVVSAVTCAGEVTRTI